MVSSYCLFGWENVWISSVLLWWWRELAKWSTVTLHCCFIKKRGYWSSEHLSLKGAKLKLCSLFMDEQGMLLLWCCKMFFWSGNCAFNYKNNQSTSPANKPNTHWRFANYLWEFSTPRCCTAHASSIPMIVVTTGGPLSFFLSFFFAVIWACVFGRHDCAFPQPHPASGVPEGVCVCGMDSTTHQLILMEWEISDSILSVPWALVLLKSSSWTSDFPKYPRSR